MFENNSTEVSRKRCSDNLNSSQFVAIFDLSNFGASCRPILFNGPPFVYKLRPPYFCGLIVKGVLQRSEWSHPTAHSRDPSAA